VCTRQPITTQLQVIATNPGTVLPRVIINFGTGQQIPQTNSSDVQYAPGTQTLYGIWDWDFGTWDGMSRQRYQSLSSLTTPISRSTLQQQTVTGAVSTGGTTVTGYRTVSDTGICFVGQTCAGQAGKDYGWYMDLPGVNGTGATEQVIYNPIEAYGGFVVNTTVPANNSPFTCSVQTAQGWTMAINPLTGGALGGSFFGAVGAPAGTIVSGVALSGTGSPSVVSANQVPYLVTQTVNGTGAVVQVNPQGNSGGRLTWIEVR
jgi:type IV pilus assembly protein PilY1